jgi:hypothetical protein
VGGIAVKYRVSWDPDAFRNLLRQWHAAGKPDAATRAFEAIENELGTDAHRCGESREGIQRILLLPPIGVIFEARQNTGDAVILDAWLITRRSK